MKISIDYNYERTVEVTIGEKYVAVLSGLRYNQLSNGPLITLNFKLNTMRNQAIFQYRVS